MAKKPATSTNGAPKPRKPRTPREKAFTVHADPPYLVSGFSKRKVEAAVWIKPAVSVATTAELRNLSWKDVPTDSDASAQMRTDAPVSNAHDEQAPEFAAN